MRNSFKALFILLPLLAIGQTTKNRTFTHSVQLQEQPETVWNAITDFSTFSMWDSNVVDIRCAEELAVGGQCKVIVGSGQIYDVEILELVPNKTYTVRYRLKTGNVYIQRSLEAANALTLTEKVWYTGISKRNFESFKGADYNSTLATRLQDFKKYLEEDLAVKQ